MRVWVLGGTLLLLVVLAAIFGYLWLDARGENQELRRIVKARDEEAATLREEATRLRSDLSNATSDLTELESELDRLRSTRGCVREAREDFDSALARLDQLAQGGNLTSNDVFGLYDRFYQVYRDDLALCGVT